MPFLQINSSHDAGVCLAGLEREMLLLGESRPCAEGKVCCSFWLVFGIERMGRTRTVGCSHLTLLGVLLSVNSSL